MQGEGKRPPSQPPSSLHEQLSPPAGIHPLSTPPSSLTTPLPLKKKKLLKVILKAPPTPNPNRLSPSLLPSTPSSPQIPSSPPPLSAPLLPHHHHHLQQHQLHHHQQLLLQQQHLHKQRLLQQQTQQLASELQLKLHQQHLLQQEHPRLLEQFKQQLQQEQICASSSFDLQANPGSHWPQASSFGNDQRQNSVGQEILTFQEKGEDPRNALLRLRHDRSKDFSSDVPADERFTFQRSRLNAESGENRGWQQALHEQLHRSVRENGQEQITVFSQEGCDVERELPAKRPKLSNQHHDGSSHIPSSLRISQNAGFTLQEPAPGGVLRAPGPPAVLANGLHPPSRPSSASSCAALLDSHDTCRLPFATDSRNNLKTISKSVTVGTGPSGEIAADPSSKASGGSGIASVPGKKVLRGILDKLQKKDSFGAFSEPVDANEVPDYYDAIKEPMDFGTMRKRISSNFYTNLELFEKDIFAICNNAMTFNATGTVYHRQARAIKSAAERILGALRTSGTAGADALLKQKTGGSHVKKSHKKKQPWTSEYVSDPLPNVGGRGFGRVSGAGCVGDSYYVDWQGGAAQLSSKVNFDDKEDPPGSLAKAFGLNDSRRWQLNEESRRGTYRPLSTAETSSLATTVFGGPLQFVPAAFQLEFSYARSVARFAADLGPEVWKIAQEKVQKALPPGTLFGQGWVGQRELPGRPIMPTVNKAPVDSATDSQGKVEYCSNEVRGQGVENDHARMVVIAPVDSKGPMMRGNQEPADSTADSTGTLAAILVHEDMHRLSETTSISNYTQNSMRDNSFRDEDRQAVCDQDSRAHQNLPHSAQAVSRDDVHCEGDEPILIHGRDLVGRHYLHCESGQSSGLHNELVSTSLTPISGMQSKLNKDG